MKVSVIVTTHCRPQLLGRALDSVVRQTHKDLEVIVVDDNGAGTAMQKETETVVSRYPNVIYHVNGGNLGKAASLNWAINRARAEILAFLDDDDEFRSDKLAKQVARMEKTNAAGVYCNYQRIFRNKLYYRSSHAQGKDEGDLALDMLLGRNEICGGSTLLLRNSAVIETGGFDERFKRHVDWAFLVCYFRKYKLSLCDEVLVTVHMDDQVGGKSIPHYNLKRSSCFFRYSNRTSLATARPSRTSTSNIGWTSTAGAFNVVKSPWLYGRYALPSARGALTFPICCAPRVRP